MKSVFIIIVVVILTIGFWFGGYNTGYDNNHRVVYLHEIHTVTKEVPVEVPVEIIVETEVDRLIEVPVSLTNWKDPAELRAFLDQDPTDTLPITILATSTGSIKFNDRCELPALELMRSAEVAGKRLSFIPLNSQEYKK